MRSALIVASLLLCMIAGSALGTPILTVQNPDYDFGSIGIGYMVTHTFILENTGDETLEIFRVRASCGCSTTELETNMLRPGETTPLEVRVVADHDIIKNVTIYVYSNAPDQEGIANDDRRDEDIQLHVKGDLTPKPANTMACFELDYDYLVLLDVRDADAFQRNHFIGALHASASDPHFSVAQLPRDARIVVCDLEGEAAMSVVQTLTDWGYAFSLYLVGGMSRWSEVQGGLFLLHGSPLPSETGASFAMTVGSHSFTQGEMRTEFYVLIDTRSAAAYQAGHLAGAINVSLDQLASWAPRIPAWTKVILYDQDGSSITAAIQAAQQAGFSNAVALIGGLDEWIFQYGDRYILH